MNRTMHPFKRDIQTTMRQQFKYSSVCARACDDQEGQIISREQDSIKNITLQSYAHSLKNESYVPFNMQCGEMQAFHMPTLVEVL